LRFTSRSFFRPNSAAGVGNLQHVRAWRDHLHVFIVVALFKSHGVGGVLVYMVGLLVVEILVVLTLGVEPKKRRLEELETEAAVASFPAEVRNP